MRLPRPRPTPVLALVACLAVGGLLGAAPAMGAGAVGGAAAGVGASTELVSVVGAGYPTTDLRAEVRVVASPLAATTDEAASDESSSDESSSGEAASEGQAASEGGSGLADRLVGTGEAPSQGFRRVERVEVPFGMQPWLVRTATVTTLALAGVGVALAATSAPRRTGRRRG